MSTQGSSHRVLPRCMSEVLVLSLPAWRQLEPLAFEPRTGLLAWPGRLGSSLGHWGTFMLRMQGFALRAAGLAHDFCNSMA